MTPEKTTREQLESELKELRQQVVALRRWQIEREYVEEELRQREKRFSDISANAREWIWEVDVDGKYTYSSPSVERILGYAPEEILGKHFFDLFHPEERETLKRAAFEVFAKKESFRQFVNRNISKNGDVVWLSTSGVPVLDEKGDLVGYRGADTDISDLKRDEEIKSVLFSISQAANVSGNLEELLKIVREQLGTLIDTTNFYVALYHEKEDNYSFPLCIDEYEETENFTRQQLKRSLTDYVRRTGIPLFVDAAAHQRLIREGKVDMVGTPSKAWLGSPLKTARGTIGVLAVQSYRRTDLYSHEDLELLNFVSDNIALVIDRKRTEQELRESEQQYKRMFESSPEVVGIIDKEGNVLDVNGRVSDWLGYTPEEIVGENFLRLPFLPEESKTVATERLHRSMESGDFDPYELDFTTREGEKRVGRILSSPIHDEEGRTVGELVMASDVTERRQAEDVQSAIYRISEEAHSARTVEDLFSSIHNIIGQLMPAENFYIALYDASTETLSFPYFIDITLGEGEEAPVSRKRGKGLTEHVLKTGEALLVSREIYEKLVEEGKVEVFGRPAIDWLGVPLKAKEKTVGVLAVQSYTEGVRFEERDKEILTFVSTQVAMAIERKRTEEALKRAKRELEKWNVELENKVRERTQELQEAQRQLVQSERLAAIGQLAATVAHELRNPHGVLQNCIYFLTGKLKDADGKIQKYLDTMSKELSRSDRIISELLDFSRKKEPSLAPTDFNEVLEEVLSKVAVPEGVKLKTDLEKIPTMIADGEQLQSVFLNLISNGIQAMPDGGTLTVSASQRDGLVEVNISDTGVGISEEDLEKVFEPLFTTKSKGIGLGLTLTKRLIENHGGTIDVESRPEVGSTFSIKLPLERNE